MILGQITHLEVFVHLQRLDRVSGFCHPMQQSKH